ncbi:hypothetical protein PLESTB_001854300 [Pleodorina starrii]|uniref:Uncharacterized protein n=1 Tax=Pleodorina starrii TaxID=330485 RepID=A0A9W6C1K1_9CHLO|nr:hypothetical protein PLESTB_001854300 [Pleodorina starrii]GLC69985.1 hypothetical protein PLESTF_000906800 [Pleodorina starrii]
METLAMPCWQNLHTGIIRGPSSQASHRAAAAAAGTTAAAPCPAPAGAPTRAQAPSVREALVSRPHAAALLKRPKGLAPRRRLLVALATARSDDAGTSGASGGGVGSASTGNHRRRRMANADGIGSGAGNGGQQDEQRSAGADVVRNRRAVLHGSTGRTNNAAAATGDPATAADANDFGPPVAAGGKEGVGASDGTAASDSVGSTADVADAARAGGGGGGGGGGLLSRLARGKGSALLARRGGSSSTRGSGSGGSSSTRGSGSGGGGGADGGQAGKLSAPVTAAEETAAAAALVRAVSGGGASPSATDVAAAGGGPPPGGAPGSSPDAEASTATMQAISSNSSSSSGSSGASVRGIDDRRGGGGGGGGGRVGTVDPLVARLARVVSYVERELLGDPEGAAAAAAIAAVHPDVPLPPPVPPPDASQPLELFAEPPMTGRLLARAATAAAAAAEAEAEAGPQLGVSSAPSHDEWRLLGGATPAPPMAVLADGNTPYGGGGDGDSAVADELFRRRERDQVRYRTYLRQFVLRTATRSGEPDAGGRVAEGGDGDGRRQQQRERQRVRRQERQPAQEWEEGAEGAVEAEIGSAELQRALLDEIYGASDWLQLRDLLEATGQAFAGRHDSAILAAVFVRAPGLLPECGTGGTGEDLTEAGARDYAAGASGGGGGGGSGGHGAMYVAAPPSPETMMASASSRTSAFGPAEAAAYDKFCKQLAEAAEATLTWGARARRGSDGGSGGGGNGCSGPDVAQIAYGMGELQIRSPALYDAVLLASGEQLRALAAGRAAAAAATAAAAAALAGGAGRAPRGRSAFAEMAAAAVAATGVVTAEAVAGQSPPPSSGRQQQSRRRSAAAAAPSAPPPQLWTPADLAGLAWGVATSYGGSSGGGDGSAAAPLPLPDKAWLRALCEASSEVLGACDPTQMWRLLWSLARLSYVPPEEWMRLFLERANSCMGEFETEGLCRIAWALAAMDHVPDRLWLRALVGQLHNRLRDLSPEQLVSLYGSLARLGYAPRPEVGSGVQAAAVRLMPLMRGEQLAALAYAAASFERWRPGGSFLRALARAVQPHAAALSPAQASRMLWCWARSGGTMPQQRPQPQQLLQPRPGQAAAGAAAAAVGDSLTPQLFGALTRRVLEGMRSGTADGTDLSMALWALAVLRRPPGAEWMAAWWRAAADPRVAATFDATSVAQSLWAAAQLKTLTSGGATFDGADMYGSGGGDGREPAAAAAAAAAVAALLAQMSGLLRATSTANLSTTIAALADLQYRPSDAWMTLFAAEARRRLGSETAANEDHGLIAYGLAVLGWPLEEPWVRELAAGGYRRMYGMSGEAIGLFLWGLSQYGWSTDSKRFWDTVFRETSAKWDSCSARSAVLLYCAVADMMPPDMEPPLQWQRQLAKALRLRVPRPPAAALIPAALRAAAGGCLGPSPLRLRGTAAAAAATPGGLHVSVTAGGGGGSGGGRQRRSALDESLWSSLVYGANLYGDLGVAAEAEAEEEQEEDGEERGARPAALGRGLVRAVAAAEEVEGEEEVMGPDFPEEGLLGQEEWDLEGGFAWGEGDASSYWQLPGLEDDEDDGGGGGGWSVAGEDADAESDEEYYERLAREMYGAEDEWGASAGAGGGGTAAATVQQQQQQPSTSSPYVFDPRMSGPDPTDPYGLLAGGAASSGGDDGGEPPFQLPLPPETTDPRDHPALAMAASEQRVWWAHDLVDELRWLWGFPGALRGLPPWVRQPSMARLRKMVMRRR